MTRVEKTVFLSYRRTNAPWALAVFQALTQHGYDVFFDFIGIATGDFERVVLENIEARAHFLILLTPSALERCGERGDWFRREIETAIEMKRNIVPLMLDGFDFDASGISDQITGGMAALKNYNGLRVHADYFFEAMGRLRDRYLNVPVGAVLHPVSAAAQEIARDQHAAAVAEPPVQEQELTAQAYFERGFQTTDPAEKNRFYSQAILLSPEYAEAFTARGHLRAEQGDQAGAQEDFDAAIRITPYLVDALVGRAALRLAQGDQASAMDDLETVLNPKPDVVEKLRSQLRREEGPEPGNSLERLQALLGLMGPNAIEEFIEELLDPSRAPETGADVRPPDFENFIKILRGWARAKRHLTRARENLQTGTGKNRDVTDS